MNYISTRGKAPILKFDDVLLAGLAEDGGLYVPETWPQLREEDLEALAEKSYVDAALQIMMPFVGGAISETEFSKIVKNAYQDFRTDEIAPLKQLEDGLWVMELFHGPTLAFKDIALQFLGQLFDTVLAKRKERITIVGATSGDTGSAAIEACRDKENIDIFILYPNGRISEVQRRQMTTVQSSNVYNIAIEGSFDDCQNIVKALFNDLSFRFQARLSAINSINWARILAQIVYYVVAGVKLGGPVSFAVPTGNFGNVYAAYCAKRIGAPIEKLVVGTNRNDILDRFFKTGEMQVQDVVPSLSPSMDIQVSSNFERFLFEVYDRDAAQLREIMDSFKAHGKFGLAGDRLKRCQDVFISHRLDDDGTKEMIKKIYGTYDYVVDPHTAVGLAAALACKKDIDSDVVVMATAHPSKFSETLKTAIGFAPDLPAHLADLYDREERYDVLPKDVEAVKRYVQDRTRVRPAA